MPPFMPMPPDGTVEMRGVAGEEHAALAIGRRQSPVNAIGPRLQHLDAAGIGHDVVQQVLLDIVGQRLLDGLAVARIEAHAPDARQPQQAEGAVRLPAIGHVGQPFELFVKRKQRGRENRRLGIDVAGHLDVERLPHHAARAIGADHIVRGENVCSPPETETCTSTASADCRNPVTASRKQQRDVRQLSSASSTNWQYFDCSHCRR